MPLRIFRRLRIAPGVTINLSRSGGSLSVGPHGRRVTVAPGRVRGTLALGTGVYVTRQLSRRRGRQSAAPDPATEQPGCILGLVELLVGGGLFLAISWVVGRAILGG